MGTSQSRDLSASANIIAAEENESDDEFVDCNERSDSVNADINEEIAKISQPLEEGSQSLKATRSEIGKQIESDDDDDESFENRKERQRREMEDFREEMNRKRELRQQCIKKLREELLDLREKLSTEIETNSQLRDKLELSGSTKSMADLVDDNKKLRTELAECQMFLQTSNSENINKTLENRALRDQARSLKEAISAVKEMLKIRECQVDQMKSKLTEIEASFAEKETKIMSTALQQEYQRQLDNIRRMRELYEERANVLVQERDALRQKFDDKDHDLQTEIEKSRNLSEYIGTLENNLTLKSSDIEHLESELTSLKSEKAQVASEMSAVNQLIAQVLFGFNNANGSNINVDKLVRMLEQNRDLLNEMAIKEDFEGIDEGSFLPKLLYDLFLQVDQEPQDMTKDSTDSFSTPEEIAEKLPKVWRVLIELLNHHKKLNEDETERVLDDCYKSVQTAAGTQNVLSVSKTFIKLKDLILEKRSLQKDTTRLKTLYNHLEKRLDTQEKRLSNVSLELTKTWHLVGKIRRQNRQLHTHEQILCYQLQQKKRIVSELKAELEYCRKKWALAKALNNESEEQMQKIRHEFSMRKIQDQNSAESGYSDEHPSDDEVAGPSKKVPKFDENLLQFDRTASPTYSERRHSESPLIHDFTTLCLFSRAQSEPPRILTNIDDQPEHENEDVEKTFEVLDLIPDPIKERCIAIAREEPSRIDESRLLVTPPPEVHVHNPPKLRAHMRKHKKEKKRKQTSTNQIETAEEMYLRLMASGNSECSTCSSTSTTTSTSYDEDIEEIQEIPMDTVTTTFEPECQEVIEEKIELQPSTSTTTVKDDDLSILSTKEQDFLKRREERLQRLEAEAKAFYDKMARNKVKGQELNQHINDIHQNFLERHKERKKSEDEKSSQTQDEPSTSGESESQESKTKESQPKNDKK